jgi:hypothetical protein
MGRSRGRRSLRHAVLAVLALSLAVSLAAIVPTTAGAETAPVTAAGPDDEQLAEDQAPIPAKCGSPPLTGCRLTWYGKQAPTLVVWGDSHLWMMTPAVVGALRGQRVNVVLFFLGGCIPSLPDMEIYAGNACAELSVDAMTYLQQLEAGGRRYRLLLGSFWGANLNRLSYYESQERADIMRERRVFTQRYTRPLFQWLGREGIPTDVSVQGPIAVPPAECDLGSTPFWCPVTRRDAYYKDTYVRSWLARRMSRLPEGARLVDYSDGICSATTCPAVVNGVHTWFDAYHVSATKAAELSSYYRPTVRALLRKR